MTTKMARVCVGCLLKRADFVRVKEQGQRFAAGGFALQALAMPDESGLLVGFTAASKTIGNAVKRNRARRRLKAAFDRCVRLNPAWDRGGWWLVLVARPAVLEVDFDVLLADMDKALKKLGVAA